MMIMMIRCNDAYCYRHICKVIIALIIIFFCFVNIFTDIQSSWNSTNNIHVTYTNSTNNESKLKDDIEIQYNNNTSSIITSSSVSSSSFNDSAINESKEDDAEIQYNNTSSTIASSLSSSFNDSTSNHSKEDDAESQYNNASATLSSSFNDSVSNESKEDDIEMQYNNNTSSTISPSSSSSLSFTSWINKNRERSWYNKTCYFEYDSVPIGLGITYDVSIFYHVGMIKNWRSIMLDQLHTLEVCGLGYIASDITISFSNPSINNETEYETMQILTNILYQFPFIKHMINNNNHSTSNVDQQQKIKFINVADAFPYERPIMENISAVCRQMLNHTSTTTSKSNTSSDDNDYNSNNKTKIVFYFHNKGCSKYVEMIDNSTKTQELQETYDNIFNWRKYMEWFLLEKPTLCIRAHVLHQAKTCGVDLRQWATTHYSGNFWTASCHYIKDLPSETRHNYVSAEMWIGNYSRYRRDSTTNLQHEPFINLFQLPFDLYINKSSYDKYEFIISQKTFIQMNHTYSYKKQWENGYITGNQTNLFMNYLNSLENIM